MSPAQDPKLLVLTPAALPPRGPAPTSCPEMSRTALDGTQAPNRRAGVRSDVSAAARSHHLSDSGCMNPP